MSDLVTFVRARLDEREAEAYLAAEDTHRDWQQSGQSVYGNDRLVVSTMIGGAWSAVRHITANDPAYVLRDIAAKRAIVEEYGRAANGDIDSGLSAGYRNGLARACLCLAATDSDHPDYDGRWRL
jgi:hypothetical protein